MSEHEILHVVFDGPPGPQAGRFVEVETPGGRSVNAGEWHEREDGYWELRITRPLRGAPYIFVEEEDFGCIHLQLRGVTIPLTDLTDEQELALLKCPILNRYAQDESAGGAT